ncbi:hypothetical protein F4811DRAFT_364664 [Daldinia bambusicola]|nr:hypothetical protein F4811DRAFT_364664 [Daldinia bambusicola]
MHITILLHITYLFTYHRINFFVHTHLIISLAYHVLNHRNHRKPHPGMLLSCYTNPALSPIPSPYSTYSIAKVNLLGLASVLANRYNKNRRHGYRFRFPIIRSGSLARYSAVLHFNMDPRLGIYL